MKIIKYVNNYNMASKFKNVILMAAIFSLFLLISFNVQAASFTDNQTVDSNKTWTIKFTSDIGFDDLTKQSITVTDSKGTKVNVGLQLGQDGRTITVTAPQGGYTSGKSYILNIGNKVHSTKGKVLNKEYKLNFNIKSNGNKIFSGKKIKSGSLSIDYDIKQALSDIDKFKLNTLNIPVEIKIDNLSSSNMIIDELSEEKAISLIKQLKGKDINIILEPYPWITGGKSETKWNPDNMSTFFSNWKMNVLKPLIDNIANPYNVDVLNIGSNFVNIEPEEKNWCDTIDYVRKYYKGLVTYRTNKWDTASWAPKSITDYENKLNNKLFSKLDFISIAAYFELTNNDTNTVENLVSAIECSQAVPDKGQVRNQNIKREIKNFYDKWNKPIFFGELGFPKINGASIQPWNPWENSTVNNAEQANCFEAYRREFEDEPWVLGFSVFAIGSQKGEKIYYPSKQSTSVIRDWYSKEQ
ncbi:glycoside hydrolase family 113 [Clostridium ljungdahlii]|uniref:SbsA Ig-like domain-containing protein n=1 Tax=Clostridium ljungdahlii TaxID=1538 RepID=A0A166R9Q7_9CLOT|nr:Ig-like domain-containing protein [Clostridium ljungdahlii]OAA90653.1 hypothetical protein WY13_01557 [Clostridium ljungdahlii]